MERGKDNTKHHQKHKRHLHGQSDAYELYELEHMPYELTKARSGHVRPEARPMFTSDDYYESEIEVQPYWRPIEGGNGVVFKPDPYESGINVMQPYWSSPENINDDGDCKGNVDCEAEKFITLEHEKFALSNCKSSKKK